MPSTIYTVAEYCVNVNDEVTVLCRGTNVEDNFPLCFDHLVKSKLGAKIVSVSRKGVSWRRILTSNLFNKDNTGLNFSVYCALGPSMTFGTLGYE